jgi:lipopolysaccharide biosynthesis glycosyltransferase
VKSNDRSMLTDEMARTIPVMHCFDNNFVIPASVALYSLLKNGHPAYRYKIHALHSDITEANQAKLHRTVADFGNAELVFIDMRGRFSKLFDDTRIKGHYSKEMFYKLLAPSILPDHEKVLISDVDVVFQGDVSRDFENFNVGSDIYLAGSPSLVRRGTWVEKGLLDYQRDFTDEEIKKLKIGAGYYIANLAKMRADGLEGAFLKYANDNASRLRQPEQDVLNLVCFPKIKLLPADSMVCTYSYELYQSEKDFEDDLNYSGQEVKDALAHPIQLHYAGAVKPWNKPDCAKSEVWFEALTHTPFLHDHLLALGNKIDRLRQQKELFSFSWPFSSRKIVVSRIKATD